MPAVKGTCHNLAMTAQAHTVKSSAPLSLPQNDVCARDGVPPVCCALRPSCSKVTCQTMAVATAHLSESSAPRSPSRPAGSQRDAMQCQPPVALRGLLALPLAVHACRHQETGLVSCSADRLRARQNRFVCALPGVPDALTHGIKSQSCMQALRVLQVMNTPSR